VRGGIVRRRSERVDHVLRRPDLGIPAPEIDEWLPVERSVLGNLGKQRGEVLLRKTLDPVRAGSHQGDRMPSWAYYSSKPSAIRRAWTSIRS
jgi:hypothetical protein